MERVRGRGCWRRGWFDGEGQGGGRRGCLGGEGYLGWVELGWRDDPFDELANCIGVGFGWQNLGNWEILTKGQGSCWLFLYVEMREARRRTDEMQIIEHRTCALQPEGKIANEGKCEDSIDIPVLRQKMLEDKMAEFCFMLLLLYSREHEMCQIGLTIWPPTFSHLLI